MWVLDHNTNDNSTTIDRLPQGIRYLRVRGKTHFSPHYWLNRRAELHQQRLLRYGYKCVLFTEVDEFVASDPTKYPGGLKEYLFQFANDENSMTRCTNELENRNPNAGPVDTEMNWSMPLLSQRHTWATNALYSKPLLTKFPLRYTPGFHKTSERDRKHIFDSDLYLLHMAMSDVEYCKFRHAMKASLAHKKPKNEMNMGVSNRSISHHECLTSQIKGSVVKLGPAKQMASYAGLGKIVLGKQYYCYLAYAILLLGTLGLKCYWNENLGYWYYCFQEIIVAKA